MQFLSQPADGGQGFTRWTCVNICVVLVCSRENFHENSRKFHLNCGHALSSHFIGHCTIARMNELGALENSHAHNMCSLIVKSFHSEQHNSWTGRSHTGNYKEKKRRNFCKFGFVARLFLHSHTFAVESALFLLLRLLLNNQIYHVM